MSSGIQNWDSGGEYDSGLQYDVNVFPSSVDVQPYLDLVTQEHNDKPNFLASLTELLQPFADNIATLQSITNAFDLDNAVGDQLDIVGEWVGRTRYLSIPLSDVYFSFGIAGLGFGDGVWRGPFDPLTGLVALPDAMYRTYLRSVILSNQWDGTIPKAYEIWDTLFAGTGFTIFIVDNDDMSMFFGLVGGQPDAVTLALLTGGYLDLRPEGVQVTGYYVASVPGTPIFGFGSDNSTIGGFGHGSWNNILAST